MNLNDRQAKKAAYLVGLASGKTRRQSALDAGYAWSTARNPGRNIESPDVKEAFQKLIRRRIPAHKISQRIAEGLDATDTKFFADKGVVVDQREVVDWAQRRNYAQLAAEYGGYISGDTPTVENNIGIKVTVEHIGAGNPATAQAKPIVAVLG